MGCILSPLRGWPLKLRHDFPDAVTELHHDEQGDALAGVQQIEQEIIAVDIVDVAIIGIGPVFGPGIDEDEGITSVFKARLAPYDHRTLRAKMVAASELGVEAVVGNMSASTLGTGMGIVVTFLASGFLLCGPHLLVGSLVFHFFLILFLLLLLLVFILFGRLGFVLPRRFHFILPALGLGLFLPFRLRAGLFLPCRLIFLLFLVLGIECCGSGYQGRE